MLCGSRRVSAFEFANIYICLDYIFWVECLLLCVCVRQYNHFWGCNLCACCGLGMVYASSLGILVLMRLVVFFVSVCTVYDLF